MTKDKLIFALTCLATIFALVYVSADNSANLTVGKVPDTVPHVDIQSYLGTWYEQAVIPYYFERGCTKTKAVYSLNKDGTIRVDNSCVRNGKVTENVGKAIPEDSTNAKLKVEFVQTLDVGGQYWIVRLGKDYSYSVVSSPNYRFLWILYRQPVMPEDQYRQIIADLEKDGFPVNKLERTQQ